MLEPKATEKIIKLVDIKKEFNKLNALNPALKKNKKQIDKLIKEIRILTNKWLKQQQQEEE
jgi:uncharacterized coiled-coil protein SlyX